MPDPSVTQKKLAPAFVDSWLQGFLEVFESKAGIQISEDGGLPATSLVGESSLIGLEQSLDQTPGAAFWIGVTQAQAERAGTLLVGKDEVGDAQPGEALFHILRSSLDAAVRIVTEEFRLGDTRPAASKTFGAADSSSLAPVRFSGPDIQFEIYLGISPRLQQLMDQGEAAPPSGLDQLFDFELPVSFSFGRKKLALREVLKLAPSAVVELDRAPDDLVEVIVNDNVIAWGEVVSVDGQYGIRIRKIAAGGLRTPAMTASPPPVIRGMVEA